MEGHKVDDLHVGLPGWVIRAKLVGSAGPIYETRTDGTGHFVFPCLPPGRYLLWEIMREGWAPVTDPEFEVTVPSGSGCVYVRFKNRQATATPTPPPTWTPTPIVHKDWIPWVPGEPPYTPTPTPTTTPTRTLTPTATRTQPPTATRTATPGPPITTPLPGGLHLKDVAVNEDTHRVYVSSRDNNRVYMLDGTTLSVLGTATVGSQPWGLAVNPNTNKLYVANWASRNLTVLNASNLAYLKNISLVGIPTFVQVNPITNRVFVAIYSDSQVAVIDGFSDTVEASVSSGGSGAWGIAVNPNLNRVYVGHRDTGTITTLDGYAGWSVLGSQIAMPCSSSGSSVYSLAFNRANNKLYSVCAPTVTSGPVNTAVVYQASAGGLSRLATLGIYSGSAPVGDAGGGIAVNTTTGNAFVTNSATNTVNVIGGFSNSITALVGVGLDPFGAAADSVLGRIYVVNRGSGSLTAFFDTYPTVAFAEHGGRLDGAGLPEEP